MPITTIMNPKDIARAPAKLNEKVNTAEIPVSQHPGQESTTESDYDGPKPSHFLARPGNNYTPLIPLDELPESVKVAGLPLYVNEEHLLKHRAQACFPVAEKHAKPYQIFTDEVPSSEDEEETVMSDDESVNIPSSSAINVS